MSSHDLIPVDLDGTLSDPLVGIGRSINNALEHFGHAPLEFARLATYVGPPIDETFARVTGARSAGDIEALIAKFRERYGALGYAENVLYPGIAESIAHLAQADVPLAICTSKRVDFAERIVELFGLRSHFRFVSGGDIGIPKWRQIDRSNGSTSQRPEVRSGALGLRPGIGARAGTAALCAPVGGRSADARALTVAALREIGPVTMAAIQRRETP